MSLWSKITSLFSGENIVQSAANVVDQFVHTKQEQAELKLALQQVLHRQQLELQKAALEADAEFNNRIRDLEGTSKDLIQAGWPGRLILFLRGAQRPLWGFGVMLLDFMVFSGHWQVPANSQMESILWVINALVLGFLFGERALQNVLPHFKQIKDKQ